jgi:DNA-binding transcriptional MerR regulator
MDKSPDAFRTISEVAEVLDTPAHVLRFWESRFPQIRPVKRAGGRRYYRPSDVALLTGIKRLLHNEGLTIRGVQKILRDQGVRHVAGLIDPSVLIDDLMVPFPAVELSEGSEDILETDRPEEIAEAALIAVDRAEPEPAKPRVTRQAPAEQSVLPLFDRPTFACLIRGLRPGTMPMPQPQLAALASRLSALRALLADRADGGRG